MGGPLGQLYDFGECVGQCVLFDGEAVDDDPVAFADLLGVGVFGVHLEERCLFCLDRHARQVDVDVLELQEALLSEAGGHLEVSGGVIDADRFLECFAQLERHSAHRASDSKHLCIFGVFSYFLLDLLGQLDHV